jgi:hypothetical protein
MRPFAASLILGACLTLPLIAQAQSSNWFGTSDGAVIQVLNEKEQKAKNKACGPGHVFVKELGCIKRERAEKLKEKEKASKQQTPAPAPEKKGGSYCSQPVAPTMEALARQTCTNNHPGGWLNCEILEAGPNGKIRCCCNWL